MFPTIRSRSDLQTSCSECTRRRWLRGSIARERFNRSTPRPDECLYALETLVRLRPLDRSRASYRAPTRHSDGRMESSKFELICGGTLSRSCRENVAARVLCVCSTGAAGYAERKRQKNAERRRGRGLPPSGLRSPYCSSLRSLSARKFIHHRIARIPRRNDECSDETKSIFQ